CGADALGRQQNINTAARTEIENGLAFVEVGERGRIAAAERCEHGSLRQAARLRGVIQIVGHWITATRPARPTGPFLTPEHLDRRLGALLSNGHFDTSLS